MEYEHHAMTNEFLDSLTSHMFLPPITQPTRVINNSKKLIDNIFSNIVGPDSASGNVTATISGHLPQFAIVSNTFSNRPSVSHFH